MKKYLKKHWIKITLVSITLPILAFGALCFIIGSSVKGAVSNAQSSYSGDPVTALIQVATSENTGISERNRAIWALGQLGSSRAMPALQSLYTGEPCDHKKLICQHEVEKAIQGCGEGLNIGAVFWRHGELALNDRD
jgi:hypothetical protein